MSKELTFPLSFYVMSSLIFPVQEGFKSMLRLLLQRYVLLERKSYLPGVPKALVISIIMLSIIFHHLQSTLTVSL